MFDRFSPRSSLSSTLLPLVASLLLKKLSVSLLLCGLFSQQADQGLQPPPHRLISNIKFAIEDGVKFSDCPLCTLRKRETWRRRRKGDGNRRRYVGVSVQTQAWKNPVPDHIIHSLSDSFFSQPRASYVQIFSHWHWTWFSVLKSLYDVDLDFPLSLSSARTPSRNQPISH